MTGSLPLSFVPLLQSSGFPLPVAAGGPPPPPPPPLLPPGARYGNPEPPNHVGSGVSPGGPPPLRTEEGPSSGAIVCTGSVVVCVAMTVVIGGNLEVAVWLLDLERVGINSANVSSCLLLFSSSLVGILISMLSGGALLLLLPCSSSELSLPLLMGPHSLQSVTSESGMWRP